MSTFGPGGGPAGPAGASPGPGTNVTVSTHQEVAPDSIVLEEEIDPNYVPNEAEG
jgi:hypothetical protein